MGKRNGGKVELQRVTAELEELRGKRIELHMSGAAGVCLMGALQLALRHPEFDGEAADLVRKVAKDLEEKLCTTQALAEVARRGWD